MNHFVDKVMDRVAENVALFIALAALAVIQQGAGYPATVRLLPLGYPVTDICTRDGPTVLCPKATHFKPQSPCCTGLWEVDTCLEPHHYFNPLLSEKWYIQSVYNYLGIKGLNTY